MPVDPRITQAKEAAEKAREHEAQAEHYYATRNVLIMQLRQEDPKYWTYSALADAMGVSIGLIAKIVKRMV